MAQVTGMNRSAEPKTILYVHSSDEMYGADRILLQLVENLDRSEFRPIVIIPTDVPYDGLLTNALRKQAIDVRHWKTAILRRKYFTLRGMLLYIVRFVLTTVYLIRLIHRERVAIVHSNTVSIMPGAVAAWLTRTPHVWHVHEIIVKPRSLWKITSWLVPRLSQRVVAVSTATRDHLCAGEPLNRQKAIVIHNGIETERFEASVGSGKGVRFEWTIPDDVVLVGMIARVSFWKGQSYFLNTARLVCNRFPDTRFAMVGGVAPGQEDLLEEVKQQIVKLELQDRVIVSDFRSDIPAVLDAFDIFVLPSIQPDPFPTVVLEAMAAGKPVVANAHGGSVEMVIDGETGYLVAPQAPEMLADAICDLIMAPEKRRQMGIFGRKRLHHEFSLQAFMEKWQSVYRSLGQNEIGK